MIKELFGTYEGQLSLLVIVTIIGMAVFFTRMFLKKMSAGEQVLQQESRMVATFVFPDW